MHEQQREMVIDALQQHSDKKCHACGSFGHFAKDCWKNKGKRKGNDSKGNGGKKGKGKGQRRRQDQQGCFA